MDAVRRVEESRGCRVVDVSAQKCGWDLTVYEKDEAGSRNDEKGDSSSALHDSSFIPHPSLKARHIEVKGRVKGATTVTITRNEMLYALNQSEKFHLAIVLVGEDDAVEGPFYLQNPFDTEPGWGISSVNYDLKSLLEISAKS